MNGKLLISLYKNIVGVVLKTVCLLFSMTKGKHKRTKKNRRSHFIFLLAFCVLLSEVLFNLRLMCFVFEYTQRAKHQQCEQTHKKKPETKLQWLLIFTLESRINLLSAIDQKMSTLQAIHGTHYIKR